MPKRKADGRRRPNFTGAEVKVLLQGVQNRRAILFSTVSMGYGPIHRHEAWDALAGEVSVVSGAGRTAAEVKRKWADMKSESKKRVANRRKVMLATGGETALPGLSEVDQRVQAIVDNTVVAADDKEETGPGHHYLRLLPPPATSPLLVAKTESDGETDWEAEPSASAAPPSTSAASSAPPATSAAPPSTSAASSAPPATSAAPPSTSAASSAPPATSAAPPSTSDASSAPPATSAAPLPTSAATPAPVPRGNMVQAVLDSLERVATSLEKFATSQESVANSLERFATSQESVANSLERFATSQERFAASQERTATVLEALAANLAEIKRTNNNK